jgi:hypothetical protein
MKDQDPYRIIKTPDLSWINDEFQRAGAISPNAVGRDRADDIRYCRWKGRSTDYKKHRKLLGYDPTPWEDGWDSRVFIADAIIEDLGDVLCSALKRAQIRCRPTDAMDMERAANAEKVIQKYVERDGAAIFSELELGWQFTASYGGTAAYQITWNRELALKMEWVKLEEVVSAAQRAGIALQSGQVPPEMMEQVQRLIDLPNIILDPALEDVFVQLFQQRAAALAEQLFAGEIASYGRAWLKNYKVSSSVARQVVRDLRETGSGQWPRPYLVSNAPEVVARELGFDFFLPPEATDVDRASWIMVREFLTPVELAAAQATEGWSKEWVDEATEHAGETTIWSDLQDRATVMEDEESSTYSAHVLPSNTGLVEVITTYMRCMSREGIPQIWCTVWCPHVLTDDQGADLYAAHYAMDTPGASYPFVGYRWRRNRRNVYSTPGIPALVGSDQASIKRSTDMLVDRQDVEVNPPWVTSIRRGQIFKANPGNQIPVHRGPDELSRMPPPTGSPQLAFELIHQIEVRLARRFGLFHPDVPPAHTQAKLQALADRFLQAAADVFRKMLGLIQSQATDEELARIAGPNAQFPRTSEDIAGEYDVSLHFDVKDLDFDYSQKKLQSVVEISKVLDRSGSIDSNAMVRIALGAVDPTLIQALLPDQGAAGKAVLDRVKNDMAQMFLGVPFDPVEADPTARAQLQFAEQIVRSNPNYQAGLGLVPNAPGNERFTKLFEDWKKNRQQSVKQEENVATGRLGINPQEIGA